MTKVFIQDGYNNKTRMKQISLNSPEKSSPNRLSTSLRKRRREIELPKESPNRSLEIQSTRMRVISQTKEEEPRDDINSELTKVLQSGAVREYLQRNKLETFKMPSIVRKHKPNPISPIKHRKANSMVCSIRIGDFPIKNYYISYRLFPQRSTYSPRLRTGNANTFDEFNKER